MADVPNDLIAALRSMDRHEFAKSLVAFYDRAGFLTQKQLLAGSKLVGGTTPEFFSALVDGLYIDTDEDSTFVQVYKVFHLKGKRTIRRRGLNSPSWSTITDNGFAHERIAKLLDSMDIRLLSFDEMVEIGRKTGLCCICGRSLDDKKSIESGIGPVCAKKSFERIYS